MVETVPISKISIYIPSNRTQPIFLVSGVIDATYELAVNKTRIGTPYLDEINIAEAAVLMEKVFNIFCENGNLTSFTTVFWTKSGLIRRG